MCFFAQGLPKYNLISCMKCGDFTANFVNEHKLFHRCKHCLSPLEYIQCNLIKSTLVKPLLYDTP